MRFDKIVHQECMKKPQNLYCLKPWFGFPKQAKIFNL